MIKINGSLINETHIVGIGPLYRIDKVEGWHAVKFTYNVYLLNYSIEISTDRMNVTFEENKKQAVNVYEKFEKEYKALYNTLQAGDWEIYKTYTAEVEKKSKKLKSLKG